MPQADRGRSERERKEVDREMANWTRWVALFTGCLFLASIASDVFIFLQYWTAANTQRDTREQLRAVVTNSNNVIFLPEDPTKPGAQLVIAPTYQNFGGTRTSRFKAQVSLKFFEGGVPTNLDLTKPYLALEPSDTVVGPTSSYQGFAVAISSNDVTRIEKGEGQILYWGTAEYADIFEPNNTHHLRVCTLMTAQKDASGKFSVQPLPYRKECNNSD